MKILAIVTGIGYGDATRDYAILQEIKKRNKDAEVKVVAYDNSYNYFKNKFDVIKFHGYKLPGYNLKFQLFSFIALNLFLPFYWVIDAFKIRRMLAGFSPDIILSDLEPTAIVLSKLLKKKCIMVFGYDPKKLDLYEKENKLTLKQKMQRLYLNAIYNNKNVKLVIIPTLLGKKTRYGKYVYINPIIRQHPDELASKERLMKKLKLEKEPILVMIGGSKFGLTLANKLFRHVTKFEEDFIFFGYTSNFSRQNIKAFEFKENFLEYLKVSKGIITLAGYSTLTEALLYKSPMLVLPISNHIEQALNAFTVKDHAFIGDNENVEESIKRFIDSLPELRLKMSSLIIQANGKEEAADLIMHNVHE